MDDNNLPETEKLISSFTKITSSSREVAISFLETHQWSLDAAVSTFTKNEVAVATADENILRRNLTLFQSLRIKIPASKSSSPSYPSRGRFYLDSKPAAAKSPFGRQTIKSSQGVLNAVVSKRKFADFSRGTGSGSGEALENYDGEDNRDKEESSRSMSGETVSSEFEEETQEVVTHIVTIWRNGFTVDDSPLKSLDEPENATFIESITGLESPRLLDPVRIQVKLIRREKEDFTESQAPFYSVGITTQAESGSASTEPPALAASPPMRAIERPEQSPEIQEQQQQDQPYEVVTVIVTIWRNGFTVDDSPLESLDDPDNAAFLESITSLESPRLLPVRVQVKIIRREEDFTESPSVHSVERTLPGSDSVSTEPPALLASSPMGLLVVDPGAPTTSVQLRLADGISIVTQFNTHHTVRDVRGFIDASRPDDSKDYQLFIMGFPPTPLPDFDQTIEKAGIANNSVLIQIF